MLSWLGGWVQEQHPGSTRSAGTDRCRFRRPPLIFERFGCQGTATAYYPTPPSDGLLRAIGKGRDIRARNIVLRVVGADGGTVQAVAWPVVLHMLNPEGCTNRPCCQPSPGHLDRRVQLVGIWVQVQHVSVEDRPLYHRNQVSLATAGIFAGCFAIQGMILCSTADLAADLVLQTKLCFILLSAADGILALLVFCSFAFVVLLLGRPGDSEKNF